MMSMKTPRNTMKTSSGITVQIRIIKRDGSLFVFDALSFSKEDDSASVIASGCITCDGAVDVSVEHGRLSSADVEDIASHISSV